MLAPTKKTPRRRRQQQPAKDVGYVYDVRMRHHWDLEDPSDPHPEDPRRIYWIYSILKKAGLLDIMQQVPAAPVSDAKILQVHTRAYLGVLKDTELMEQSMLAALQEKYDSVFLSNESQYCARLSAGGLLALCEEVVRGRLKSGLAIVRPPGHHACAAAPMGFCLLNNVAIAVRDLQSRGLVGRVLVVDWDIHHGNGIQDVFYGDKNVLYFSIHRHDDGKFYPSSSDGDMDMVGRGAGAGYNVNVPWASSGVGDGDYMYVFKRLLLPIARAFAPELVVVAAGFDAAVCDPIGECEVSPQCYACMTSLLKTVADGRLVLSLEGGYNLDAIANSALACVKALLGIKWAAGLVPEPAAYLAYATLPEAEVNGIQLPAAKYSPSWDAEPSWDPAVEVPECFRAAPSKQGKAVVDRVTEIHRKFWPTLR
ncbi:Histone deacetylase hda1 [Coemansia javaensis]|uniref:histone deacetylase n=1 Tax=Coemansia javaensis TaxID=2761396 RepID=A0A9W8HAY7_9FUNG|nr:Histone deacetylase hda1 [Coemansia javaensis]